MYWLVDVNVVRLAGTSPCMSPRSNGSGSANSVFTVILQNITIANNNNSWCAPFTPPPLLGHVCHIGHIFALGLWFLTWATQSTLLEPLKKSWCPRPIPDQSKKKIPVVGSEHSDFLMHLSTCNGARLRTTVLDYLLAWVSPQTLSPILDIANFPRLDAVSACS